MSKKEMKGGLTLFWNIYMGAATSCKNTPLSIEFIIEAERVILDACTSYVITPYICVEAR